MANSTTVSDQSPSQNRSRPTSRGRYGAALPFQYQDRPAPVTHPSTPRSKSRQRDQNTQPQSPSRNSSSRMSQITPQPLSRPQLELIESYASSSSQSSNAVIEADSWLPYERTKRKIGVRDFADLELEEERLRQRSSSDETQRSSSEKSDSSRSNGSGKSESYSETTPGDDSSSSPESRKLRAENEQLKVDIARIRQQADAFSQWRFSPSTKQRVSDASQAFLDSVRDGSIDDQSPRLDVSERPQSSQSRRYLRDEPLSQHDTNILRKEAWEMPAQEKYEHRSMSIPRLPQPAFTEHRRARSLTNRRRPKVYYENVGGVRLDTMPRDASYSGMDQSLPEIEARDIRQIMPNPKASEEDMSEYSDRHDHFAPAPPAVGSLHPTRSISPKPYYIPQERVFQDGYSLAAEANDPVETEFGMPSNVTAAMRRLNSANVRSSYHSQTGTNGVQDRPVHPNLGSVPEEDDDAEGVVPVRDPAALRQDLRSPDRDQRSESQQHVRRDSLQSRCREMFNAILGKTRSEDKETSRLAGTSEGRESPTELQSSRVHAPVVSLRQNRSSVSLSSYQPQLSQRQLPNQIQLQLKPQQESRLYIEPESEPGAMLDWSSVPEEFAPQTPKQQAVRPFQEPCPTQYMPDPEDDHSADCPTVALYRDPSFDEGRRGRSRSRSSSISRTLPKFKNMLSLMTQKLTPHNHDDLQDALTLDHGRGSAPTGPAEIDLEPSKSEKLKAVLPSLLKTSSSNNNHQRYMSTDTGSTDPGPVLHPGTRNSMTREDSYVNTNGLAMHPPSPASVREVAMACNSDGYARQINGPSPPTRSSSRRSSTEVRNLSVRNVASAESMRDSARSRFRRFERVHLDQGRPTLS